MKVTERSPQLSRQKQVWKDFVFGFALILCFAVAVNTQTNFRVSDGTSPRINFAALDSHGGTFHPAWSDSSSALVGNPDGSFDIATVPITLNSDGGIVVGANVNVSRLPNFQTVSGIAANPTNPNNLVAVGLGANDMVPDLFRAFSTDGGATWTTSAIIARGDEAQVVFDSFGNCFVAFIDRTFGIHQLRVKLLLSTDGGVNFTPVSSFSVPTDAINPALAVGEGSVWVLHRDVGYATPDGLAVNSAPVFGLGQVGNFTAQTAPGSPRNSRADIAVSPNGQVLIVYANAADSTIKIQVDADGLGAGGFAAPIDATNANQNEFQNEPMPRLGFDWSGGTNRGRAYLVYVDSARLSNTRDVFLRFSEDNGTTWSAAIRANDNTLTRRFRPEVSVDRGTGNLGVIWFDERGGDSQIWGNAFTNIVAPSTPNSPLNLRGTAISSSQIDLTWTDTANNETGFQIERQGPNLKLDGFRVIATVSANVTSFSDTGSAIGGFYRVRAINGVGASTYSNELPATIIAAPPVAPSNLTANAITHNQIDLSWQENCPNSCLFKVERGTDGVNFTEIAPEVNGTFLSDWSVSLQPQTTYFYRVRAFTTGGTSGYSNIASATTLASPIWPPQNLTATALSSSEIRLDWTDPNGNETGFEIERSRDGFTFSRVATVGANATSFTNTRLRRNTQYFFRARAVNANSQSPYSYTVAARTLK